MSGEIPKVQISRFKPGASSPYYYKCFSCIVLCVCHANFETLASAGNLEHFCF
jgi:hypothetical protein